MTRAIVFCTDPSEKVSEILNRDISPLAAAYFYDKVRIKIFKNNSTSTGAGKDSPAGDGYTKERESNGN